VVVWDDGCGFCGTWVRWFRRLDWLRALRFVPRSELASAGLPVSEEQAAQALQLVTPRRVRSGFGAVVGVAELLPVSFLWAPLLRLPPVMAIGSRVYANVAARRSCDLGGMRSAPATAD
jgi:predicted DCC family thiol-disulfide oxidoreductase YuxK